MFTSAQKLSDKYLTPIIITKTVANHITPDSDTVQLFTKHHIVTKNTKWTWTKQVNVIATNMNNQTRNRVCQH